MRKLVTLRTINALNPIEGADVIEVATIDGWKVVVKKGDFKVGDPCLYFEIDSFLPSGNPAWQFLVDKQPRTFDGVVGHRLRTVKLRGQISQGLALPPPAEWFIAPDGSFTVTNGNSVTCHHIDDDLTELLGVVKWDPPVPAELAGQVLGFFPGWMKKTDQERCQNILNEIFVENAESEYEVSLKLDGTSVTYYHRDGQIGVCSRNLEYKINDENQGNTMIRILFDSKLAEILPSFGNIAIQGELMGLGIQGNREKLATHRFYIFDMQNLDTGEYYTPAEREKVMLMIDVICQNGVIESVPIYFAGVTLSDLGIANIDQLLAFAEGPSLTHPVREGMVFKRKDGKFSFKVISNSFLAKEKD
jgi:RNA ligase (TIGR02306 family)